MVFNMKYQSALIGNNRRGIGALSNTLLTYLKTNKLVANQNVLYVPSSKMTQKCILSLYVFRRRLVAYTKPLSHSVLNNQALRLHNVQNIDF